VGTGFSNAERARLLEELKLAGRAENDCKGVPSDVPMIPVALGLVVKVRSHGFTESGHLRAPVYQGVREDRSPEQCTSGPKEERLDDLATAMSKDGDEPTAAHPASNESRVHITNRDKIFWPDEGYTKGELLDYYEAIAPILLPHLKDRPVVLVRYPDGILGKSFYQWRAPDGTPSWVQTLELYDEERQKEGETKAAFLIDSSDALLHVVNLGCIPIHVLASRKQHRHHCDFLTVDFDLGSRPFSDGIRLALGLKEITEEMGLESFPKTSGQRGLHVLIPLGSGVGFESAKLLCELLGRIVVGKFPEIATMERRIEKRGDKVYVDTGQTGRSRTIVSPYSVRAFAGARVSTPLRWSEIHLALDPAAFTIETVVQRLRSEEDPMATLLTVQPDLRSVLSQLSKWTGDG
jgi:bifunctional non-homologous end joining protein LigD